MGRLRLLSSVLLAFGTVVAAPAAAAPESPDAHPGTPNWTGCGQLVDTSEIPTAQCTMLAVPVDYADPAGAQARLAVLRVPATGQRVGALLVNPGGPGASAVDAAAGMAAALRDTPSASTSTWSASIRAGWGIPPRNCGAAPTRNSTRTGASPWSITVPPGWPTSRRC